MRFGYVEGICTLFSNNAELDDNQVNFFSINFPFRMAMLENIKGTSGKIEEVTDVSFDAFWTKYNNKVDKIEAEKYYNKMSKDDKIMAISGINKYKSRCAMRNVAPLYPVRYLKRRRWEDED